LIPGTGTEVIIVCLFRIDGLQLGSKNFPKYLWRDPDADGGTPGCHRFGTEGTYNGLDLLDVLFVSVSFVDYQGHGYGFSHRNSSKQTASRLG
jgi:hypothetical protein